MYGIFQLGYGKRDRYLFVCGSCQRSVAVVVCKGGAAFVDHVGLDYDHPCGEECKTQEAALWDDLEFRVPEHIAALRRRVALGPCVSRLNRKAA